MPGLFVGLSVLAFLLMAGMGARATPAMASGPKKLLTPDRRWAVAASFATPPDQAAFERTFRANAKYMFIEGLTWISNTSAVITIIPVAPVELEVGVPGPGGQFMIANVMDLGLATRPAVLPTPSDVATPARWLLTMTLAGNVLDRMGFESDLKQKLRTNVISINWTDPKRIEAVVVSTGDLKGYVGRTENVKFVPTTIIAANKLPLSAG